MKKDYRLYNMILPPYLIMAFSPIFLAISAVGNFIIDSVVLLIISAFVFRKLDSSFYVKNIFKVWGLGFAADFVGVIYLFIGGQLGYDYINSGVPAGTFLFNIFDGMNSVSNHSDVITPYTIGFLISGIIISAICVFVFDFFIAFRKSGLTKKQRLISSAAYAVFTAPYTFLLPYDLFYS